MKHLTEDDLVLHYYGERGAAADIEAHLRACADCAAAYEGIRAMLAQISAPSARHPGEPFWQGVRERAVELGSRRTPRAALVVWLVPILYPLVGAALFHSAQVERGGSPLGVPLMVLALAWAFAGPVVALVALRHIRGGIHQALDRLVAYGAVVATVSPPLFNLTSRTGAALLAWYAATAAVAVAALLPVPDIVRSTHGLRRVHRTSALLIGVFAAAHLTNHAFAIFNVAAHSAVLDVLRIIYRQPVIEMVLLGAIAVQIATGATLVWQAHLRRPALRTSVQALSGVYLAVFFVAHVSAALTSRPATETDFVWAAGQQGLLASPRLTLLLPHYLLGVSALLVHVGLYAHSRLLAVLPPVPVQRLSYAGMALGAAVTLTIGLALCGVHLVPETAAAAVSHLVAMFAG